MKDEHKIDLPNNIILEGRNKLSITGVEDVERFDETQVLMYTSMGALSVIGSDLHIDKLNLENGELSIVGQVDSLEYTDDIKKGGLLGRLFG